MDARKVKYMLKWLVPRSVKELKGFFGLTTYYRRFIKGYGVIAKALTKLLKKGNLSWIEKAQTAFETLK